MVVHGLHRTTRRWCRSLLVAGIICFPGATSAKDTVLPEGFELKAIDGRPFRLPTSAVSQSAMENRTLVGPTLALPEQSATPTKTDLPDSWRFDVGEMSIPQTVWSDVETIERHASSQLVNPTRQPGFLGLGELIKRLLQHSIQGKLVRLRPLVAKQQIGIEYGSFDPSLFIQSQFDVENLQQKRENHQLRAGIRKPTLYGGELEIGPALGIQDNAIGVGLEDQGIATVDVIYRQELLRDSGIPVVLNRGLKASLAFDQQRHEAAAELNEIVKQTIDAYWQLYFARADYFVQQSRVVAARSLVQLIQERAALVDALSGSLRQSQADLNAAIAELATAEVRVRQAEDALFRLVNDPSLDPEVVEWVTITPPRSSYPVPSPDQEFAVALQNRTELQAILARVRTAAVDQHVSMNQLLPRLTFSLRSSLNGFAANRDYASALNDLGDLHPSAAAVVDLEWRVGNRVAKSQAKEASLRIHQGRLEFDDQIEVIRREVRSAHRTLGQSDAIVNSRMIALENREQEIRRIFRRTWVNPQEGTSFALQLEQLFQSLSRLVAAQQQFFSARVQAETADVELQRAKGVLAAQSTIPNDAEWSMPGLGDRLKLRKTQIQELTPKAIREYLP